MKTRMNNQRALVLAIAVTLLGYVASRRANAQEPQEQLNEALGSLSTDAPSRRIRGLDELLSLGLSRAEPYNVAAQATTTPLVVDSNVQTQTPPPQTPVVAAPSSSTDSTPPGSSQEATTPAASNI